MDEKGVTAGAVYIPESQPSNWVPHIVNLDGRPIERAFANWNDEKEEDDIWS